MDQIAADDALGHRGDVRLKDPRVTRQPLNPAWGELNHHKRRRSSALTFTSRGPTRTLIYAPFSALISPSLPAKRPRSKHTRAPSLRPALGLSALGLSALGLSALGLSALGLSALGLSA
ncbi:hypothetical protein KKB55_16285, partial [Myxococcota bacterium]|nr:hypothetical protein [Myxococcota bacterium]